MYSPLAHAGAAAAMYARMSDTVCDRLNLATLRLPSRRRSWIDVDGADSSMDH